MRSSTPRPAAPQSGGVHLGHGRRSPRLGVLGHVHRVTAVGPAPQVDPLLGGHAQAVGGLVAGQDEGPRHVDVHDRHRVLGVRIRDHPVLGGGVDQVLGRALEGEPGVGIGRRHPRHGGHELADGPSVGHGIDAEVGPAGDVPQREGQVRLEDLVGHLGRVEGRLEGERRRVGVAVAPRRLLAGLLQPALGVEGLRPADDPDVDVASQDGRAEVVDQALGCRAPDTGVLAMDRVDAERGGQTPGGVVVLPALAVDDLEAADRAQHVTGRVGCRPPRPGRPAPTSPAVRDRARPRGARRTGPPR